MGDLRPNFSRWEFRCKCGCGKCEMDEDFLDDLQRLRDRVGVSITVTSGYRCNEHNRKIGGHPNSRHTKGQAADIHIKGMDVRQMYLAALRIPALLRGGIGVYPQNLFIHVDRGRQSRWGVLYGEQTTLMNALSWLDDKGGEDAEYSNPDDGPARPGG